jgi:hypothetical protein
MSKAIVILGNIIEGHTFVGPFDSDVEATDFAESLTPMEWHVAPLESPKDDEDNERKKKKKRKR